MSSSALDVNSNSQSLFIRAGAGAGKTTQLIRSFGEFVTDFHQRHQRFPRVVITTFTRKATQEVKERLLVNALKNSSREVFEYINKKSSVQISTIHGLLRLFLNQNTEVLSLPHDLKIVDQSHSDRALRKAIHSLMKRKSIYTELLEAYPFYRLLEISRQALDLKYQNRNFQYVSMDILLRQTEEKRKAVIFLLDSIFRSLPVVPDKWKEYFSFLQNYQTLLKANLLEEALLLFEDAPKKPSFLSKNPPFEVSVHDQIEEVRKENIFLFQDLPSYREQHEKLNRLFFEFVNELFLLDKENKKRTGELTISDLENYSLILIQDFPEATAEFSKSWDFFMIDEYQDTSPLQVQILNEIVADRPCFIVGDPQQSIYLFRGARSEVFEQKQSELKSRGVEAKILNTNYRSDPKLMTFMNEFFKSFKQSFSPMVLKEASSDSLLPEQVHFIQTYDQVHAVLKQIKIIMAVGVSPQDICVLSRKNSDLNEVAQLAYQFGIPVQLQAAGGFESKREILDLVSFLKFLVNPFDSENLVGLLRSPWLFIEDQILVEVAHQQENIFSLWSQLSVLNLSTVLQLKGHLENYETIGAALTLKKFIHESGFLACSELLDPSGRREANIWKFLTTLAESEKRSGFSLCLFIEDQFSVLQSDLGSSAVEAQPVIQPDRVSLMTVHASKGLEFKHVIVLGLTDRPQQTNVLNLAFDAKTAFFSLSPYIEQESKLLASAWSTQVRKEFNQRELSESERVLYVAMTRAQQSVSLIARMPRPEEKWPILSETWYRKISWPEASLYSKDYALKVVFHDDQLDEMASSQAQELTPRQKKFIETAHQAGHHSVTDVLSTPILSTENFQRNLELNIRSLKKAQRGTELHRLFESLKYISLDELQSELNPEEVGLIRFLFEQKHLNLSEILAAGYNEWGFGLQLKDQVLQGQIDAWAELPDEVHVLDYKTGSPEYSDVAFEQLAIYTYALLKMNKVSGNKKIVHSVIYPVDQKIIMRRFESAADFKSKHSALAELFR